MANTAARGCGVLSWLWTYLRRFVLFTVVVIGGARAYSWLLGYDDEVKVWASANRPIILLVLALSAIVYAMYFFLDESTKR